MCAHLADDSRNCGNCGVKCLSTEGCVAGKCVAGQGCAYPSAVCDGACVAPSPSSNADHCGSCNNRCADAQLCIAGKCTSAEGQGIGCSSPLIWDLAANEIVGFRMSPPASTTHVFSCGPLTPLQTRWFRFTATKNDTDAHVRSYASGDDYVIEMFSDIACDGSHFVACDDNSDAPDPKLNDPPTIPGKTFWVAVGLKNTWSGRPATLRADH